MDVQRFVCIVMMSVSFCLASEQTFRHFKADSGKRFDSALDYLGGGSMSEMQCAAMCAWDDRCMSASYSDVGTCFLSIYHLHGPENGQILRTGSAWTALSKTVCQDGWIKLEDKCYLFIDELKNLTEAKDRCYQEGGMMVEPRTMETHVLLTGYMAQHLVLSYWIGLEGGHDVNNNYNCRWVSDGSSLTYDAWRVDEPHQNDPGCILSHYYYDYKMADDDCHPTHHVACQSDLVL